MAADPRAKRIGWMFLNACLVSVRGSQQARETIGFGSKEAWDKEMLTQHAATWPTVFMKWMQHILDVEPTNSFSKFVHDETLRVFKGMVALHVPGV